MFRSEFLSFLEGFRYFLLLHRILHQKLRVYIYIYIYILCVYIYIYRERERDTDALDARIDGHVS